MRDAVLQRPQVTLVAASLDILGGQGIQADTLIRNMRADGYQVTLLPINPTFPRGTRWIRRVPYLRTLLNQLLYLMSLARLRKTAIVHVFSASYWSFVLGPLPAMLIARMFGKYVVLHYHSGEADDHLANWGWLVHPWLRLANKLIVPSIYLKNTFALFEYQSQVVPNVIELGQFSYRSRSRIEPKLLSVRNLEAHYGIDTIIRAFSEIKAVRTDARLTVVGYGSQEATLRNLVHELNLRDVCFAGRIEPVSMAKYYDQADIFLNASTVDNQPVSVLEAFAAGLPVITTGIGDIENMVRHGAAGIIVPCNNPTAIANAVLGLLDDPAKVESLAHQARSEVERYTWKRIGPEWANIYREVAA